MMEPSQVIDSYFYTKKSQSKSHSDDDMSPKGLSLLNLSICCCATVYKVFTPKCDLLFVNSKGIDMQQYQPWKLHLWASLFRGHLRLWTNFCPEVQYDKR